MTKQKLFLCDIEEDSSVFEIIRGGRICLPDFKFECRINVYKDDIPTILKTNKPNVNRPYDREYSKKRLAPMMKDGQWCEDAADPLMWNIAKEMNNGQHRLNAQLMAGVEKMIYYAVFGISKEAMIYLDRGRKRTSAQTFAMHGIPNPSLTSATVNMLENYRLTGFKGNRVGEPKQLLDAYFNLYPDLDKYIMKKSHQLAKYTTPALASAVNYMICHTVTRLPLK